MVIGARTNEERTRHLTHQSTSTYSEVEWCVWARMVTRAPYGTWKTPIDASIGRSGYTHQWRIGRFWRFRRLVMASVESIDQAKPAHDKGWRTFRTAPLGTLPIVGEFACPASAEQGYRLTCEQCGACNGTNGNAKRASIVIQAHGSPSILASYRRTFGPNEDNGGGRS